MRFIATDEQVKQIGCNAINASVPMGTGFLSYQQDDVYTTDMLHNIPILNGMSLDYVGGRMVKLWIARDMKLGDHWEILRPKPKSDYQSWCGRYPTYQDLVKSVGVDILEDKWS